MPADISQLESFFEKLGNAGNSIKNQMPNFMEAAGNEFLRIVQDEIIRREVVDTRLLLNSFQRGGQSGIYQIQDGGLSITVGTNVEYAAYVNDGHWTNTKGVYRRWVPGRWSGSNFTYDPGSKTGMSLKQKWVQGKPYWDSAVNIFGKMFPDIIKQRIDQWFSSYF